MNMQLSFHHLPPSLREDLEQLRLLVAQLQAGEIDAASLLAFRVPQGIYEQRESGTYMLRARLPAGIILPAQMRAVAALSRQYGNGQLHLTSRQDIQLHRVALDAIYPALVALANVGLSGKGGGGNTVRNIAACPHAGVCPHESFDVTPHVCALTDFLLSDPRSFLLPRKYKIAFSGCGNDCAAATVQDLGFISKIRDGVEGFAVYLGGGMGTNSRVGVLLEEFIPTAQAPRVAEAIKRVFDQHGNRENRRRARIRFLLEDLGLERLKALYQAELQQMPAFDYNLPAELAAPPANDSPQRQPIAGFEQWKAMYVRKQRQPAYYTVEMAPRLGIIDAETLIALADIVERYGEQMLRVTNRQSALLRGVNERHLPALHAELAAIGLTCNQPWQLRYMVTCTGAGVCRLGICRSRELSEAISDTLTAHGMPLGEACGHVSLHISGCPNACSRHPLAQIGFYGVSRRVGEVSVPHYILQLGGRVHEGQTRLAEGTTAIPASNIPNFLLEFLQAFRDAPQYPDFDAYLDAGGRAMAEAIAQRLLAITELVQIEN